MALHNIFFIRYSKVFLLSLILISFSGFSQQDPLELLVHTNSREKISQLEQWCNEKLFFTVVKTAFNQRRKTLRNALKPIGDFGDHPLLAKRAEQLSVNEFVILTQIAEKLVHATEIKQIEE